jgi:hypothetical protein
VFAARLAQSPMPWPEVHALQLSTGMSARDLTACCLRHGWIIDTTPWRLRRRCAARSIRFTRRRGSRTMQVRALSLDQIH